jgi:phosphate transport system permease protein
MPTSLPLLAVESPPQPGGHLSKTNEVCSSTMTQKLGERIIEAFLFISAATAVTVVAMILIFLLREGLPLIVKVGIIDFCLGMRWNPIAMTGVPEYGIFPMIVGSFYVAVGSLVLAVPFGIACAVFLAEIAPSWARSVLKHAIELLVGIPSVILGFVGLVLLVPFIRDHFGGWGFSILTCSIILAIMALPRIISVSDDAIRAVPKDYKEASLALGATHWHTIRKVILPSARSGIVAAVILAMATSIGETMAVLMVAGNVSMLPSPIYDILDPVRPMTANIVLEMHYATGDHAQALFATGIVLFIVVAMLDIISHKALKSRMGTRR